MYQRILIVVGADPALRPAVAEGVALAKVHGAEVVFFAVLPRYTMPVTDFPVLGVDSSDAFMKEVTHNADVDLASATAVADRAGVRSKAAKGSGVDDASCIFEAAHEYACELIVVESTGSNALMRLIDGSVIPGLITLSTIPVLVVRQVSPEHEPKTQGEATPAPAPAPDQAPMPAQPSAPAALRS